MEEIQSVIHGNGIFKSEKVYQLFIVMSTRVVQCFEELRKTVLQRSRNYNHENAISILLDSIQNWNEKTLDEEISRLKSLNARIIDLYAATVKEYVVETMPSPSQGFSYSLQLPPFREFLRTFYEYLIYPNGYSTGKSPFITSLGYFQSERYMDREIYHMNCFRKALAQLINTSITIEQIPDEEEHEISFTQNDFNYSNDGYENIKKSAPLPSSYKDGSKREEEGKIKIPQYLKEVIQENASQISNIDDDLMRQLYHVRKNNAINPSIQKNIVKNPPMQLQKPNQIRNHMNIKHSNVYAREMEDENFENDEDVFEEQGFFDNEDEDDFEEEILRNIKTPISLEVKKEEKKEEKKEDRKEEVKVEDAKSIKSIKSNKSNKNQDVKSNSKEEVEEDIKEIKEENKVEKKGGTTSPKSLKSVKSSTTNKSNKFQNDVLNFVQPNSLVKPIEQKPTEQEVAQKSTEQNAENAESKSIKSSKSSKSLKSLKSIITENKGKEEPKEEVRVITLSAISKNTLPSYKSIYQQEQEQEEEEDGKSEKSNKSDKNSKSSHSSKISKNLPLQKIETKKDTTETDSLLHYFSDAMKPSKTPSKAPSNSKIYQIK
jgi:hypothetical protein